MNRFADILVVADEHSLTEPVLRRADWLARMNGARLTLIDVLDRPAGELSRLLRPLAPDRAKAVSDGMMAARRERLDALAEPLREAGAAVEARVTVGPAFIEIIRQVLRGGHDLVLKGAYRGPDRPLLRAPDLHLLRKCPCPVWILNGEASARASRILAAVDPDPEDPPRHALARLVMELATSLARRDEAALDVLTVWDLPEEGALRHGRMALPDAEIAAILDAEEAASRARQADILAGFGDFDGILRALHRRGEPAEAIERHVRAETIDTLVMGTVGRSGVAGLFIGNTAETVLGRVDCSVIAVKPRGFVSPVTLEEKETPA